MVNCLVCGSTNFHKKFGYSFCTTCQTQSQHVDAEDVEVEPDLENTLRLRRMRIQNMGNRTDNEPGWTSWELYNFIMVGLTNELINLGASPDIKITILQLWARYLGKLEIAFISTKKKLVPKLSRRYRKKDAEIIYDHVILQPKDKKKENIENNDLAASQTEEISKGLNRYKKFMITAHYDKFVQSHEEEATTFDQNTNIFPSSSVQAASSKNRLQFNSFAKAEKRKIKHLAKDIPRYKRNKYRQNHVTTQYKTGPELITPMKLWAILYLALRIHDQDIHLGDMIRYAREGHLSYYKLDHLIPSEVILTKNDINFLSQAMDITHKGMRKVIERMANFLNVTQIICPDFLSLITRYCKELHLPGGISLYAERFIALSHPKMKFDGKSCTPNYEGRVMAFIIVIMKMLLGLDGITEYEISKVAAKINSAIDDEGICDTKLFNFREWQNYIECRRAILVNAHYPTKLKYSPNIPDVNSLYIRFLQSMQSKGDREEIQITTRKHLIPRELVHAMKQCISNIDYIDLPLNEVNEFSPSLTPHHSYLQQLLDNPLCDLPNILRNNFSYTKIGYMTKPDFIRKLAMQYDISLNIIDSNLHFIEKTVPFFEQTKMDDVKDLKNDIEIESSLEKDMKTSEEKESFIEYLYKKIPCQLKIDIEKKQYYDNICNRIINTKDPPLTVPCSDEFIFNDVLPNGKLSIPDKIDHNKSKDDDIYSKDQSKETKLLLSQFCKAYNTNFLSTEEEALLGNSGQIKKHKRKILRDRQSGKFIKQNDDSHCAESIKEDYEDDIAKILAESCKDLKIENVLSDVSNMDDNLNMDDYFDDLLKEEIKHDNQSKRYEEMFKLPTDNSDPLFAQSELYVDTLKLYRPFTNYWMYHCNFSRVKSKNFELFEKMLPRSFRWLLNECANIIEMSTEDLYEEVCLIETYYACILEQIENASTADSNANDNQAKIKNAILKKW